MPPPPKSNSKPVSPRNVRPEPVPEPKPTTPSHSGEMGWLPDFVYTGEKFEPGLAFFADGLGRIVRFSREPADLAAARRLQGQAALPGLINVHAQSWHRVLRGRTEVSGRGGADLWAPWREVRDRAAARMGEPEIYEAARMAFTEMLLSGVTAVGEFHELQRQPDGSSWPDSTAVAQQILRAAHEVGIRISLFNVAAVRPGFGRSAENAFARARSESVDVFLKQTEALRVAMAANYPADEAWLGLALESTGAVPREALKPLATYAHAQRLRVQVPLAVTADEADACRAESGRSAVALLGEAGLLDKRFTALHGLQLTDDDCRLLGTARAALCACPTAAQNLGLGMAPADKLLAAGASLAFGTAGQTIDLLQEARELEYAFRTMRAKRPALAPEIAKTLFHAATAAGARSLGATGGALEVGRPADFFTVNLYDPSIAGADPDSLLANVVFALERRAIREVWIGARQRIVNGRHPEQGLIVGRFVEMQRRLWS